MRPKEQTCRHHSRNSRNRNNLGLALAMRQAGQAVVGSGNGCWKAFGMALFAKAQHCAFYRPSKGVNTKLLAAECWRKSVGDHGFPRPSIHDIHPLICGAHFRNVPPPPSFPPLPAAIDPPTAMASHCLPNGQVITVQPSPISE